MERPAGRSAASLPAHPEAVLLDVGDTLLRPEPSWRDVYASVFPRYGVEVSSEAFERAFAEAWAEWEHEGPFEATEEGSFRRLMELDRLTFGRLGYADLPETFFRDVEAAFERVSAWFVFPDVPPALDAMRAAGLKLGVVSNWGWRAPELLHLLELARHFDAFSISARVGFQKPHPAIFEHALDLLGSSPGTAIHVGDNPAADVVGARRAGIAPVLILRQRRDAEGPGPGAGVDGVPVIGDLLELLDLLGIARPAAVPGA
jgi:putative hydrolase of the HAD superfamily